jgi:hypothetical protein
MKRIVPAFFVGLALLLLPAASAVSSGPATPTNLRVLSVTEDSVTLAWGPEQPGPFYGISEDKNSLTIAWGPSQDATSGFTYELSKDGAVIAPSLGGNTYRITGLNGRKVTTFRTCVTAVASDGRRSPETCATWTKSA